MIDKLIQIENSINYLKKELEIANTNLNESYFAGEVRFIESQIADLLDEHSNIIDQLNLADQYTDSLTVI